MDGGGDDHGALPQRTRRRRRDRGAAVDASPSHMTAGADDLQMVPAAVRPVPVTPPGNGYEYLDHTADVQLHSWGTSLPRAFEQAVVAMMAYMTDLEAVEVREERTFTAEGHDLKSLLYNFMDECLYVFCTELIVCKRVEVERLELVSRDLRSGGGSIGHDNTGTAEQADADQCEPAQARRRRSANGGDVADARIDTSSAPHGSEQVWTIRARGVGERFEMGRHPQGTEIKAITYSAMQIFDRAHSVTTAGCSSEAAVGYPAGNQSMGEGEHAAEIFVIVDI